MIKIKGVYGFLDNTTLLAMKLFDKFLSINEFVQQEMFFLIAGTCLGLAVKMNENCILDFEDTINLIKKECQIEYTVDMFIQAEFQIFKSFDFNLNIPTAIELLLQVIFLESPETTFGQNNELKNLTIE